MNKIEEKTLEKATKALSSKSHMRRASDKFFERVDRWERVFELHSQGMTFEAISKVLGVHRMTAQRDYALYVELKKRMMVGGLEDDQLNEITEYLQRLEKQREELSWEISSMNLNPNQNGPTPEEQMAKNTTRKVMLDIDKQIANIKKGLGLWHEVDNDYFQRKKLIEQQESLEDKRNRVLQLLERVEDG